MAEIVGSAVAGEVVRRLSSLLPGDDGDRESTENKVERLEMAVLKLETIVAVSENWQITHPPLLHWKAKLKRVAKEGKGTLHARKKQAMERKRSSRSNSFPRRMAQVAKRLVPFSRSADNLSAAMVKRFERLAEGADDFLKFVEYGRPKSLMLLPALARSLAAGKSMELSVRMGSGTAVILLQQWWLEEHDECNGIKACLWMSYEHDVAWEKNFKMLVAFHLSESVDIMRIATTCVELLPPQFSAARVAMKELLVEMTFHGRNSPTTSAMYMCFVRAVQNSHRYGFEPTKHDRFTGGGLQLPDAVLLICAHCYILPLEKSSSPGCKNFPVELVWHSSPRYLPKKLSEQHEEVEAPQMLAKLLPGMTHGFYHEAGEIELGRQWWCPQSSTRLSMVPVFSPPTTVLQWCVRKNSEQSAYDSSK